MTPELEEMTIGDAQRRIESALGRSQCVNVCRQDRLWPDDRRWAAWAVVHTGDRDHQGGHTVHVQAPRLGEALARVVRGVERHAEKLRALLGDVPIGQASAADHAQAAALEEAQS